MYSNTCKGLLSGLYLSVSLPSVALAQLPPPERMNMVTTSESDVKSLVDDNSRASLLTDESKQVSTWSQSVAFAGCAIKLNEDRVRQLLDQDRPGAKASKLEFDKFINRNRGCIVTNTTMDRDFMRGAMAEHLIVGDAELVIPQGGDATKVKDFIAAITIDSMSKDNPFAMGQLAAECRTVLAPVQVRAVLALESGSAAEKGALSVLKSATSACDGFAVEGKSLTPWFERAFAAQALYHWIGFAGEGS